MKKYFIPLLAVLLTIGLNNTVFSQEKTKKKIIKTEKRSGKPLGEDGQVAKPNKPGKHLGKGGQVAKPEGSLATPKTYKGSASLVFFYYGDSPSETFFQESTELYRAMDDYKKVVLLKEESYNGVKLSQRALDKADIVAMPTRENIKKYMEELTRQGYFIDLWIFSHGSKSGFRVYDSGEPDHNGSFSTTDIKNLPEDTGFKYIPIRMVYQGNCYAYDLIDEWRSIGAKAALGARLVNFYPYEFARFAYQWNHGKTFKEARDKADKLTPKSPANIYTRDILAPQTKKDGKWSGCPAGYNVLGTSAKAKECGEEFFSSDEIWAYPQIWQGDGKSTMEYSSWKIVAGDYNIKKETVPEW